MVLRVATVVSTGVMSTAFMLMTPNLLSWWCLALTIGQAGVHIACSRDMAIGWKIGLGLQPAWIAYSVLTHQLAFIITAVMIAFGNILALKRLDGQRSIAAVLPRDGTDSATA